MCQLITSQPIAMATCSDSGFHNSIDLIQRYIPTHNVCNGYLYKKDMTKYILYCLLLNKTTFLYFKVFIAFWINFVSFKFILTAKLFFVMHVYYLWYNCHLSTNWSRSLSIIALFLMLWFWIIYWYYFKYMRNVSASSIISFSNIHKNGQNAIWIGIFMPVVLFYPNECHHLLW